MTFGFKISVGILMRDRSHDENLGYREMSCQNIFAAKAIIEINSQEKISLESDCAD